MAKKTKEHKPVSRAALKVREKLAENVQLLMEHEYPASKYQTASAREQALAKEAGCSWSTIQRILAPIKGGRDIGKAVAGEGVGTKIDTLADLAVVFGVSAVDLLSPNFASNHLRALSQADTRHSDTTHSKVG